MSCSVKQKHDNILNKYHEIWNKVKDVIGRLKY